MQLFYFSDVNANNFLIFSTVYNQADHMEHPIVWQVAENWSGEKHLFLKLSSPYLNNEKKLSPD